MHDQPFQTTAEGEFVKEDQDVGYDDQDRNEWK